VGDQSSGKSSVLEGLTGLPFPRDSSLCTRFPTQIVFKRSKTSNTKISIITAHGQDDSKVNAITSFGKMQLKALDQATFSEILAKVNTTECKLHHANPFMHLYTGIEMYGPSIARANP
jgi:hypothetical protein